MTKEDKLVEAFCSLSYEHFSDEIKDVGGEGFTREVHVWLRYTRVYVSLGGWSGDSVFVSPNFNTLDLSDPETLNLVSGYMEEMEAVKDVLKKWEGVIYISSYGIFNSSDNKCTELDLKGDEQ